MMQRLLKMFGTNAPIVAGDEFDHSGRMSTSSEDVLDLGGLGQRMQVGGACRRHRCSSRLARSRSVRALGCLECRPRSVTQSLPSLTTSSELPRGVDSVSRPQVVRLVALEHLEHHFRARCSERGDLTKILLTQSDLALFPCHDSIVDHRVDSQAAGAVPGRPMPTVPAQTRSWKATRPRRPEPVSRTALSDDLRRRLTPPTSVSTPEDCHTSPSTCDFKVAEAHGTPLVDRPTKTGCAPSSRQSPRT